ncbi:MAG: protein translocase SEC61 complex subunit gamma [Nanoarchaeota archaeon]
MIKEKIQNFINEYMRVFKITRKPGRSEFVTIVKASALGILIIGLIGFIIQIIWVLIF